MARKGVVLAAVALIIGAYALLHGDGGIDGPFGADGTGGVPDPYYLELKAADVQNPDDVIRYSSSIRGYTAGLDVFERAAFYEWYLKSTGFDVSFAYAEDFRGRGADHLWLLVKNKKGEVIEVDPSFTAVGGPSMVPLSPEYTRYDREFEGIFEAEEALGLERLAWWRDEAAQEALNDNIILAEKERAQRMAEG